MRISLDAARIFLDYLDGKVAAGDVIRHPAYAAVKSHAGRFGDGMDETDIEAARAGQSSRFPGLKGLDANLPRILLLMESIESSTAGWSATIETELGDLLPGEDLDSIVIYPVIGYDWGIGHDGVVAMNLNSAHYLENHEEFLYWAIHESFHVVYERYWPMPPIRAVSTPEQWLTLFHLALQNEGYATYAPLALRQRRRALNGRDYRVVQDPDLLGAAIKDFLHNEAAIRQHALSSREELLDVCFGSRRLAYTVGCELVRRVEHASGREAVRAGALQNCDDFWRAYGHLLET